MPTNSKNDNKTNLTPSLGKAIWIFALTPIAMAIVMAITYYWRFGVCTKNDLVPNMSDSSPDLWCLYSAGMEQWGQIGDFFGGVLNPIIGLITIFLVMYSIRQNQTALKQSQLALAQNEAALKQNEQALSDSRQELVNSNQIMKDQKNLMDFELKLSLFNSLLKSISEEASRSHELVVEEDDHSEKRIKSSGNQAAFFYFAKQLHQTEEPINLTLIQEVQIDFFKERANVVAPWFFGLYKMYAQYPKDSEFRQTFELSMSIHIQPNFMLSMALFTTTEALLIKGNAQDFEKIKEELAIIRGALESCGHVSYREALDLFLLKLQHENM